MGSKQTGISGAIAPPKGPEGKWWHYDEGRGVLDVYVTNHHDGEYPFDRIVSGRISNPPHIMTFWDYNDGEWWEAVAAMDPALAETIVRRRLGGIPKGAFSRYLEDTPFTKIYRVSGYVVDVWRAMRVYADMLIDDVRAGGPGADDGTYDYFPGAVEAVYQLAAALEDVGVKSPMQGAKDVYNELVTAARDTHYKDNEEAESLLPFME